MKLTRGVGALAMGLRGGLAYRKQRPPRPPLPCPAGAIDGHYIVGPQSK